MMKRNGFQQQDFMLEHFLSLMEIYRAEWQYRYDNLWNMAFRLFYANLLILFLPNLSVAMGVDLSGFPMILFPIIASILSWIFLYITKGALKKAEASAKTYAKFVEFLPLNMQRISIEDEEIKGGRFFRFPLSPFLCYFMYISLFIMSIIMIIRNLL